SSCALKESPLSMTILNMPPFCSTTFSICIQFTLIKKIIRKEFPERLRSVTPVLTVFSPFLTRFIQPFQPVIIRYECRHTDWFFVVTECHESQETESCETDLSRFFQFLL